MSRRRMVRRRLPLTHTPDSRYNHLIGSPIQSVVDRLHEFRHQHGHLCLRRPEAEIIGLGCCQVLLSETSAMHSAGATRGHPHRAIHL